MQTKPTLSKSTLRGTLLFILVLIVIFVLPDLITHFSPKEKYHIRYSDSVVQEAVQTTKRNKKQRYRSRRKKERYSAPDRAFDPNTYSVEQWMALGLSEKQASVVQVYQIRDLFQRRPEKDLCYFRRAISIDQRFNRLSGQEQAKLRKQLSFAYVCRKTESEYQYCYNFRVGFCFGD